VIVGERSFELPPKEQPPRKLSGKGTTIHKTSGERLRTESADGITLSGAKTEGAR